MADRPGKGFIIRRAQVADREELIGVLNNAFSADGEPDSDFRAIQPHLFTDERMGDHFIGVEGGRIVGCVGLYPFEMKVGGVVFRTAGVGQVGTLKEARGRGVMTSLLHAACEEVDAQRYDFAFLGGDRQRYGHFGWATGGVMMRFEISERHLPDPPAKSEVRALDCEQDLELIRRHLAGHPDTVLITDGELRLLLGRGDVGGCAIGDAFILYRWRGDGVLLADGTPDEIGLLLSHHMRRLKAETGDRRRFRVACAPTPSNLLTACLRHYAHLSVAPSGMFRVSALRTFLEKVCRVAQPRVGCGSGSVSLVNADSGEEATVLCRGGRLSVEEGVGEAAYRLNRRDLSEVCFGLCPPDVLLPGLPLDSFIRQVLPLPVYWSRFCGV